MSSRRRSSGFGAGADAGRAIEDFGWETIVAGLHSLPG
jgi:hypothetical protein